MKKQLICILCGLMTAIVAIAGDIVRVSATYEYRSDNPNESPEQAQQIALERARQAALEEAFGLDISSVTNTFISNQSQGKTASQANVLSLGETSVRGEWIETTKEQVLEKQYINGFWIVKVKVEGRARSQAAEKADIRYTFIRDIHDVEAPVSFRDGNDIYMRFSSPVAGSLCVYLVDEEQMAFCLLPYPSQQNGSQTIDANKDYVFFSSLYDKNAQEYTVNCQKASEQNALYVVFSPNTFAKANDKQSGLNWRDEPMPRQLTYTELLKWLSRNQTKDANMVVRRELITIRK